MGAAPRRAATEPEGDDPRAHLHSGEKLALTTRVRGIHLTIQTLSGNYSHNFNPQDSLQHVVAQTVDHLHITLPPGRYGSCTTASSC